MADVDLALDAIAFLEAHLTEEIAVKDVADAVSLSLFHFSRTFSRTTRHPPYDYLMRRRLCAAANRLATTDAKVIDVAFTYQFNAAETFSRAFRRMFGVQPRQVKAGAPLDLRRMLPRFTRAYIEFLNGTHAPQPVRTNLPQMTLAGVAAPVDPNDANGTRRRLWAWLRQELAAAHLAKDNRCIFGISLYSPFQPAGHWTYLAGTVLEEGETAPPSLLLKHLPAAPYARFDLPGGGDALLHARRYACHTWWPTAMDAPLPDLEVECCTMEAAAPHAISLPLPRRFVDGT